MKLSCPYCGGDLIEKMVMPPLPARQQRIYDTVVVSGRKGVPTSHLLKAMYGDSESPTKGGRIVLRVQVHELNKTLRMLGKKVKGKGGIYRLATA